MVRTAGNTIKTTGGKSSKASALSGGPSYSGGGSSRRTIGGNRLVNRPIPEWQRPIGIFFLPNQNEEKGDSGDIEDEILEEAVVPPVAETIDLETEKEEEPQEAGVPAPVEEPEMDGQQRVPLWNSTSAPDIQEGVMEESEMDNYEEYLEEHGMQENQWYIESDDEAVEEEEEEEAEEEEADEEEELVEQEDEQQVLEDENKENEWETTDDEAPATNDNNNTNGATPNIQMLYPLDLFDPGASSSQVFPKVIVEPVKRKENFDAQFESPNPKRKRIITDFSKLEQFELESKYE